MGQKEREIINKRLISLSVDEKMFRANSGMAWVGKSIKKGKFTIIENARPFHGLPEGFPDLFGFTTIEITPDMIGKKIAIFTAEEVKATGKLSKKQKMFRDLFIKMGAIYRVLT